MAPIFYTKKYLLLIGGFLWEKYYVLFMILWQTLKSH